VIDAARKLGIEMTGAINKFRIKWVSVGCRRLIASLILGLAICAPAMASECNGKSDALGVSRVIAVDPAEHSRIGTMQYPETLPLADHEVVLTFDDGPSPRYTDRILAALAKECVKATFFMVGEMAKLFPEEARKVKAEGHTVGTHSFDHPFTFGRMSEAKSGAEIDKGIQAVAAALGDSDDVAPFFRVPGLLTSKSTEAALASRKLMTWSVDFSADDWKGISGAEIEKRAISRIEEKGRGILLLHDIHEQTVLALPNILDDLKQRGYKIVQVVPASATMAKTETTPEQWWLPPAHSPDGTQSSEQTKRVATAEVGQTNEPGTSKSKAAVKRTASRLRKARARKLALAKKNDERSKGLSAVQDSRRCDQQAGCLARGCRRDGGAGLNEGEENAHVLASSGSHFGCSRADRDGVAKRLSAKAIRHRRERHGDQNWQRYAV
jgi:peptidoglycan/xylan/chitin deacetylase (PgdA/CDA1 family)